MRRRKYESEREGKTRYLEIWEKEEMARGRRRRKERNDGEANRKKK